MPLYEYACPRTGIRFEVIQKFSDERITRCPQCDEHPDCAGEAQRLLSAPAIQFKGAGWYVNDYGKAGQKPAKDGDGAKPSESKPSESKPEVKAEPKKTEPASSTKG